MDGILIFTIIAGILLISLWAIAAIYLFITSRKIKGE